VALGSRDALSASCIIAQKVFFISEKGLLLYALFLFLRDRRVSPEVRPCINP
jgi:hypothetical protein